MPGSRWGYCDRKGAAAFDLEVQHAAVFEGGVARVRWFGDRRWGLVSKSGETISPARWDHVKTFREGVANVCVGGTLQDPRQDGAFDVVKGGRWGLIRKDGTELVPPTLDFVGSACDGLLAAQRGAEHGWLNVEGRWVVEPQYGFAGSFQDGIAVASKGGRYGLMGTDGRWVLEPKYDDTEVATEGLARVKQEGRWSFVDRGGRPVSEGYETLGQHVDGLARATRDGKTAILDRAGKRVGDAWFDEALDPAGGVAAVRRGDRWSFLAPDGALHGSFTRVLVHTEGLARVSDGKAWGFADTSGRVVVGHQYDDAWAMDRVAAPVTRDGRWTWVDREGRELAPPSWDATRPFVSGLALALQGGLWGFVDPRAAVAIEPAFVNARTFEDDLCPVVRRRPARKPAAPPPDRHVLPAGGLESPIFGGATSDDHAILLAGFGRALDEAERTRLEHVLWLWMDGVAIVTPGSVLTEGSYGLEKNGLRVRVENAREPAAEIATLVADLEAAAIPLTETVFGLWRRFDKVMGPVAHPAARTGGAWFPDFPAYWREVWNEEIDPPAAESPMHLKGAMPGPGGPIGSLEERVTPLWAPGLRVCYGVADFNHATAPDPRTDAVGAAVTEILARRFARFVPKAPAATPAPAASTWAKKETAGWGKAASTSLASIGAPAQGVPEPTARGGERGRVDRLVYEGKVGYGFAIDYAQLLHTHDTSRFRYREQELLDALAEVIETLGLAKVVLWQRESRAMFGPLTSAQRLLAQVWER